MTNQTIELSGHRKTAGDGVRFRKPEKSDGADVWRLIADSRKLDENSMYCNLLQCDHFADTCIIAELDGEIVGWISGYIQPDEATSFFVWQVAVSEKARGKGIAKRMLQQLMRREECAEVERLQTTITKDNDASWALFRSFARASGATITDRMASLGSRPSPGKAKNRSWSITRLRRTAATMQ